MININGVDVLYEEDCVRTAYLARYNGGTRELYHLDIGIWFTWCVERGLQPFEAKRVDFESFIKYLMVHRNNSARSIERRIRVIKGYYKLALADELIEKDPTLAVKTPRWEVDKTKRAYLTPAQVSTLLRQAEKTSPNHHALIALMAMLGLRVSEACNADIEDLYSDNMGYTILDVLRKGGRVTNTPIPMPLLRILDRSISDRSYGPIFTTAKGNRQTRNGAYDWFKRLLKAAELPSNAHPHTLRHASITALIDSGEPIHKVQEFADHRDIRTTEYYYHPSSNPDQHSVHVTARLFSI